MPGINKRIFQGRFMENVQNDNTRRPYSPFHCNCGVYDTEVTIKGMKNPAARPQGILT